MPKQRVHFPETLPGAGKFSGDKQLNNPALLVRAFRKARSISVPLIEAGEALASPYGRPRMAGSWVLVFVGFIASRQGDIQPFHARASDEFWRECGFENPPSYSTTHARLTELEQLRPDVEEAIGRMVHQYSEIEPRIGRHIHIDGTEAETHSRFYHDCRDYEKCAWRREGETAEDVNKRVVPRASTELAQKRRQQEDAGEVAGDAEEVVLAVHSVHRAVSDVPSANDDDETTAAASGPSKRRPLHRIRTSRHSWLSHDPDAGFRTYENRKGWHGYYHYAATDDFTGLTLFGLVESSSRSEHSQYEGILRGIVRALNPPDRRDALDDEDLTLSEALLGRGARLPEAISGDSGFGYPFIYELNTRLGIQTVAAWRKFRDGRDSPTQIMLVDGDGTPFVVDADGVVHCKYCGGPTKRVELRRAEGENPRLRVRCLLPSSPDSPCNKDQTVSCAHDWRMLTELERHDERYLALAMRFQSEGSHHQRRVRNRNGAKDPLLRPRRLGRAWQQTLLSMGVMVDWFRAGIKHGWLEGTKGYPAKVLEGIKAARRQLEEQVAKRAEARRLERQELGLDRCLPSGPERPPPKPAK
jgi:hypothetical protein